jgi:hypothetical protein
MYIVEEKCMYVGKIRRHGQRERRERSPGRERQRNGFGAEDDWSETDKKKEMGSDMRGLKGMLGE